MELPSQTGKLTQSLIPALADKSRAPQLENVLLTQLPHPPIQGTVATAEGNYTLTIPTVTQQLWLRKIQTDGAKSTPKLATAVEITD